MDAGIGDSHRFVASKWPTAYWSSENQPAGPSNENRQLSRKSLPAEQGHRELDWMTPVAWPRRRAGDGPTLVEGLT